MYADWMKKIDLKIDYKEIEGILDANVDLITYKADKDFRCLTSTEKTLLENNKKIKQYIDQLETDKQKLIEILNKYEHVEANEDSAMNMYAEVRKILKGENK